MALLWKTKPFTPYEISSLRGFDKCNGTRWMLMMVWRNEKTNTGSVIQACSQVWGKYFKGPLKTVHFSASELIAKRTSWAGEISPHKAKYGWWCGSFISLTGSSSVKTTSILNRGQGKLCDYFRGSFFKELQLSFLIPRSRANNSFYSP